MFSGPDKQGNGCGAGTVADTAGANPLPIVSDSTFADDEDVNSTTPEEDGTYGFGGLPIGIHRLESSATGYDHFLVDDVPVVSEETTENIDAEMEPATPPEPSGAQITHLKANTNGGRGCGPPGVLPTPDSSPLPSTTPRGESAQPKRLPLWREVLAKPPLRPGR